MIVLGIDPGTAMTGYGIIERTGSHLRLIDYGCMETLPDRPLPERLLLIHQAIEGLIEEH
jgi:crossover junction endodeoxyribonuclease RuvC